MVAADSCALAQILARRRAAPPRFRVALLADPQPAFRSAGGAGGRSRATLDLQYYIWEPDSAGTLMAVKLVASSQRGVPSEF